LLAVNFVNLKNIWLYQKSMYAIFVQPPILSWPWHPGQWATNLCQLLLNAPTYFVWTGLTRDWLASLRFFWLGMALGLVGYGITRTSSQRPPYLDACAAGLAAVLVSLALLVKRQEALYALVLLPFLLPLAADFMAHRPLADGGKYLHLLRLACSGCCLLSLLFFFRMVLAYGRQVEPFERITAQIRPLLDSPTLRIAGPVVLWFADPRDNFRDVGAVVTARYLTGTRGDLKNWLGPWRPDVVIADDLFRRAYLNGSDNPKLLSQQMGVPVEELRSVRSVAYGVWSVYRLRWPRKRSASS